MKTTEKVSKNVFFKARSGRWIMLVFIVVLILVSSTLAVRNQITQALEKEVGAYVAETIAEEQIAQATKGLRSPEGAIYVQYSTEFFMELVLRPKSLH